MPLLVALLLYALTWATFLACQLYCAHTHGLLDNRNVRMRAGHRTGAPMPRSLACMWLCADAGARCWPARSGARCSTRGRRGWARGAGRRIRTPTKHWLLLRRRRLRLQRATRPPRRLPRSLWRWCWRVWRTRGTTPTRRTRRAPQRTPSARSAPRRCTRSASGLLLRSSSSSWLERWVIRKVDGREAIAHQLRRRSRCLQRRLGASLSCCCSLMAGMWHVMGAGRAARCW